MNSTLNLPINQFFETHFIGWIEIHIINPGPGKRKTHSTSLEIIFIIEFRPVNLAYEHANHNIY